MESSIKLAINSFIVMWWLFSVVYLGFVFAPSSAFVDVKEIQAIETIVGEKMYFISIRDAKHPWAGTVIEEINISRDNITQVVFRNQREVLTETGLKTVSREIDYIHKETGKYELDLHITLDTGFMGIKKRILLHDDYKVTF